MRTSSNFLQSGWPYGLIVLVVAALYGQSLGFGYVWDDGALFLENTVLREGAWSWEAVARPVLPDTPYFRPLVLSTWMMEMQVFNLQPLYSHAINVLIHAINTCLLYSIACRIFEGRSSARTAAVFVALLYTVHPSLTEGVAWISGRFDLMATMLILAGVSIALGPASVIRCVMVAVLSMGAMLSKETGILFAPLLGLIFIARDSSQSLLVPLRKALPYLCSYTVAVIPYLYLRSHGIGFASYEAFGISQVIEALQGYDQWLRALSFYTYTSFVPFSSISPRQDIALELMSMRQHPAALLGALLLGVAIFVFAVRRRAWAVLWLGFYIGIFPVLGILKIRLGDTIGADRFLYLPLIFLSLGLVALFMELREKLASRPTIPRLLVVLASLWILLSLLVTYTVTSMWESNLRLWSWQYRAKPENSVVRSMYLISLADAKTPEASKELNEEIERIKARFGGRMPLDVQMIYSSFLLGKKDPEALPYLEGLVLNAKDVWKMRQEESKGLNAASYAGILANYSQALMIFEGDLVRAKEAIDSAESIAMRGSEYQVIHQRIAISYLEGRKSDAIRMYHENYSTLKAYNIDTMLRSMRTLVLLTCERKGEKNCMDYSQQFVRDLKGVE